MTIKEIIDGLKFTVDMFLFDPSTGETFTEPRNDMDKTTIDACKGAIELLEQTRMKVDEQFKCKDCDNYNQCNYYHNRRETSFICKEFQNQWGYIEELEKIKKKIKKIYDDEYLSNWITTRTLNVIDERIAELKGE